MRDGHMSLIKQFNDQSNQCHAFCSNPHLIAPCFDCSSILHNSTRWPDMALCHNFHSSVSALMEWKLQNPSRCLSKGCPWAECFMRWTFGPQQSAAAARLCMIQAKQTKVLIRPKNFCWPIDGQTHAAPHHFLTKTCQTLFVPFRRLFLCLLDAS